MTDIVEYFDVVKGIGIFLVVMSYGYSNINPLYCWISSFHMPLFFFITGMLYSIKSEKIGRIEININCIPYYYLKINY